MGTDTCTKCNTEKIAVCPECGKPVEVYSRIVGYLRPTSTWNPGKVQEYRERTEFII
jgi:anaerobic ribonucleoside-triphosphate reductase